MPNPQEMSPTGYVLTMQPYNRNPMWDIPEPPPADRGLPMGGTTGQVLTKASDADYDAEWADPQGGGGTANYQDLENKPSIEGHTLNGESSLADIGAASTQELSALAENVNVRDQELEGQIAAEQADRQLADATINSTLDKLKGGAAGQVLAKKSSTDYDFEWIDVQSGGGSTKSKLIYKVDSASSSGGAVNIPFDVTFSSISSLTVVELVNLTHPYYSITIDNPQPGKIAGTDLNLSYTGIKGWSYAIAESYAMIVYVEGEIA